MIDGLKSNNLYFTLGKDEFKGGKVMELWRNGIELKKFSSILEKGRAIGVPPLATF